MTHRKTFRRWSTMKFICAAFVILMTSVGASSVNDCRGVKYAYSRKGLDQSDVPRQPRQGKKVFWVHVELMHHDWKLHFKINVIMDRELSNNNVAFAKLDTYVVVVHILNNLRSYSPSSNIV